MHVVLYSLVNANYFFFMIILNMMFWIFLAFRTTDETDLLSLWTNLGNQGFPRQRLFFCKVCGSFLITSLFLFKQDQGSVFWANLWFSFSDHIDMVNIWI